MEKRIFILGDRDAVLGFSLLGVDGLATDDPDAATARLAALQQDPTIGLILVTAGLAQRIEPALESIRAAQGLPLVYEIADPQGSPAKLPLHQLVRRALGAGR